MVIESGIVGGLAFVSFIFAYFSFKLRENETIFNQILSVLFFSISLLFVNFVIYTIMLIVQNNIGLAYLASPITNVALNVIMWVTIIVFFFFFLLSLIQGLFQMYEILKTYIKNKRGRG